jgi:hypothetical protein
MSACYSKCSDIPWYKFAQRKACMSDCDLQAQQQISQSSIQQSQASSASIKWIVPGLIVIVILIIVAKARKWI